MRLLIDGRNHPSRCILSTNRIHHPYMASLTHEFLSISEQLCGIRSDKKRLLIWIKNVPTLQLLDWQNVIVKEQPVNKNRMLKD